jgi:hypothetical protein
VLLVVVILVLVAMLVVDTIQQAVAGVAVVLLKLHLLVV